MTQHNHVANQSSVQSSFTSFEKAAFFQECSHLYPCTNDMTIAQYLCCDWLVPKPYRYTPLHNDRQPDLSQVCVAHPASQIRTEQREAATLSSNIAQHACSVHELRNIAPDEKYLCLLNLKEQYVTLPVGKGDIVDISME